MRKFDACIVVRIILICNLGLLKGRGGCLSSVGLDAAGAVIALGPVPMAEALDPHLPSRAGRVDELIVSQVDPDMGKGAVHGVKEHQVSRRQVGRPYRLSRLALLDRTAGENQAEAFPKHVLYEA